MNAAKRDHIKEILADKERIKAAVENAVREAVRKHKQAGNPVVAIKDGKMVWLQPDEIEL